MGGRNFSLTDHLSAFVDAQVGSGRHQNASEVIREALRRYEDDILAEPAQLAMIEKVAAEGSAAIARGDYVLVQGPKQSRALLKRLNDRAARPIKRATKRAGASPRRRG
ncbi:MAG: type II toxin-antitoxin system ParD family antitoxin [Proteobacteria bacterium]|nr:type II toxin-antitoxin system ParD family antitoxin [Pseudomonadota bacterium]